MNGTTITTISIGSHITAQGVLIETHADGRVTIDIGSSRHLSGEPVATRKPG